MSSSSLTPFQVSSGPAAASASIARSGQPGVTSSASPLPNAAARLLDSPGKIRAEPGWPGPRRPAIAAIAASAPVVPDRAAFAAAWASPSVAPPISAISSAVSSSAPGGGGPSGPRVLLRVERLILSAQGIQPRLAFLFGHRVRAGDHRLPARRPVPNGITGRRQPGPGVVPPGVRRGRSWRHAPHPFGRFISNIIYRT